MQRNEKTQELLFDMSLKEERNDAFNSLFTETKEGKQYEESYRGDADKTKRDRIAILTAVETLFDLRDSYVSVSQLAHATRTLILSGQIQPSDPEIEEPLEEPAIDTTPRDKNGKALTESQLAWGEMTKFANESSMDAIRQRKYVDPKFRAFVETNMKREFQEQPVGDAVINLNANKPRESHGAITEEERAFARKWVLLSVSDSKKLLSPAMNPDGPEAAARAQRLLNLVSSYGLV